MTGTITLVGTPIGNLADLSPRARDVLARADVIACEDTRRTGKLLELTGIERRGRFVVFDDHASTGTIDEMISAALAGTRVAVVSDAGMPGVSDPGERLVAAAVSAGVTIEVVPGPSAVIAALVASGLPAGRFCFEGFLPRKGPARRARLESIAADERTSVLFESPHRVADTLADLEVVAGEERQVSVAREITKLHEEHWRGSLTDAAVHFAEEPARGEVTIVVAGLPSEALEVDDADIRAELAGRIETGESTRDAVDQVTELFDLSRKRVYDLARAMPRRG